MASDQVTKEEFTAGEGRLLQGKEYVGVLVLDGNSEIGVHFIAISVILSVWGI